MLTFDDFLDVVLETFENLDDLEILDLDFCSFYYPYAFLLSTNGITFVVSLFLFEWVEFFLYGFLLNLLMLFKSLFGEPLSS